LHEKSAQELTHWVLSDNLLEASVGIAALNSVIPIDESQLVDLNAAAVIEREGKGKNVVAGSIVIDPEAAALTIQQGAAFPQVEGVRVVTL
jgi:uncharacterized protein (DUF4213/DUF364 family)